MATKNITDLQVCQAVQQYNEAIRPYLDYFQSKVKPSPEINCPPFPYEILQQQTGECFKVCYRAMERAANRGFINSGVSLRTGWLTPKGLALLSTSSTTTENQ